MVRISSAVGSSAGKNVSSASSGSTGVFMFARVAARREQRRRDALPGSPVALVPNPVAALDALTSGPRKNAGPDDPD
jgi:hypothetical protein